ncbi:MULTISPECIES: type IV secretion system protein [unclassified Candidatus Frackibacter]|uniref:type IV secretion system protein n=1 Tax=unclassified Candidatus Frackibacter TaxID=2648818 RepID=UPI00088EEE9A|nr:MULTISPECIES: type IV secretion system protein [unclassified Candidatus Frackibacter]SDC31279.1 TrbL/VirB6 plasmid conjugal transfer protein [Candidatus Frackibacter sp. WG11]SEM73560.1 TrbL/VirB6 plasmid conjugal transfer protein [Candidatus Frackibacter sp. WG12]SFL59159.1 TrbL/VirB6 plasmid conjugal transfer protein [Candidatus Frackibacter sp. WG13]
MPDSLYDALDLAYSTKTFVQIVKNSSMIERLIQIAVILAALVLVVSLFMEMYYKVLESRGSYVSVLIRLVLVILVLANYMPMVLGLVNGVDSFTKQFAGGIAKDRIDKVEEIVNQDQAKAKEEINNIKNDKKPSNKQGSFFGFSWGLPDLSVSQLLVQGSIFITQAALFVIFGIRNISLTLLTVVGPFALITLMNRKLQTYGWGWIKSFVNVLIWPVLIVLILYIQDILLGNLTAGSSTYYKAKMFGYNVVFIFFLVKVMKFLPELAQGTAGAFSTAEGLMSALLYATGLGAAKGAFKQLGGKAASGLGQGAKKAAKGAGGLGQRVRTSGKYSLGKMTGNKVGKMEAEMERVNSSSN